MAQREKCRKTFWRFSTIFDGFALHENCRKVPNNILTLFDDFCDVFWRGPFPPAPFAIRCVWCYCEELDVIPLEEGMRCPTSPLAVRSALQAALIASGRVLCISWVYRCSRNDYRIISFRGRSLYLKWKLIEITRRICICNERYSAEISTDLSL